MEVLQERPNVLNFIKAVAKEQGIEQFAISDVQTNQKGEGFLGEIFTVCVKDVSNAKKLNIVIKAAFTNEKIRKIAPIRNSFLNEIFFYTRVKPAFEKLEVSNKLPVSQFLPKCYRIDTQLGNEMLCIENLKILNFEVFDKTKVLNDDHVRFIFKTYGRFHACSFALKEQQPEEYANLANGLYNIYEEMTSDSNANFTRFLKVLAPIVESYFETGKDDEVIKKFIKYTDDQIVDTFYKTVIDNGDYSITLHGDCWSNNLMFKYQTVRGSKQVIDIRLIDLQLSKIGSPVCDLSYCLYSGGSKEIYDNLDKYLQIYHESLSSALKEFGCNPQKVFPFSALKEEWKKYARFGMMMGFAMHMVKVTHQEDVKDLTDDVSDAPDEDGFTDLKFDKETYKKRMRELVYHMHEIDAL